MTIARDPGHQGLPRLLAGIEPGQQPRQALVATVRRAHAPAGDPDMAPVTVLFWLSICSWT